MRTVRERRGGGSTEVKADGRSRGVQCAAQRPSKSCHALMVAVPALEARGLQALHGVPKTSHR